MVALIYKHPTKMNTLEIQLYALDAELNKKEYELKKKIDEFNEKVNELKTIKEKIPIEKLLHTTIIVLRMRPIRRRRIENRLQVIKNEITVIENEISVTENEFSALVSLVVSKGKKEKLISLSKKFNLNESEAEAVLAHLDDDEKLFKIKKNTLLALQIFNTFAKKNGIRVEDAIQVMEESLQEKVSL